MAIRERGDDTYEITIDLGKDPITGRRKRYYETVKGKRNAQKRERELKRELDLGKLIAPSNEYFKDFLKDWLKDRRKKLKPSTLASYEQMLNLYVIPTLGNLKMKELEPRHFVRLYSYLEEKVSNRTIKYLHAIIKKALDCAIDWKMLSFNLVERIETPTVSQGNFKVWKEEEMKRFLETAKNSWYYELYYVALTTGMRQGELLGLKWRNVDFDEKKIYVLEQYNLKTKSFEEVKTRSSRRNIAIDDDTVELLKRHKKRQAAMRLKATYWKDHDLVFCTRNGLPIMQRNLVRNFKEYIKRAGVPDIRFHDLRHTHATYCLKHKWHPKIVQERLGHSSIKVTLDTYSHVIPGLQEELAEATFEGFLRDRNWDVGKSTAK